MQINPDILIKNNNIIYASDFKCKNLLNTNLMASFTGYADIWYSLDGNSASSAGYKNTNVFADLKAGETYTLSIHSLANVKSIQLLDSDGSALVNTSSASPRTFTAVSNTRVYPRIKTSDTTTTYCIMQLEQGSEATEFTEYKDFENNDFYSTIETRIGTWMNKPLYRKVVNFGVLPSSTSKVIAHNISNLDWIKSIIGTSKNPGTTSSIPIPYNDGTNTAGIYVNSTNITITTNSSVWSNNNTYIILEYTKTTD